MKHRGPLRLTKGDMMKRIKSAGIGSEVHATDVLSCVTKTLHKKFPYDISSQVEPLFFKNKTVTLRTSSSAIAQEVRLHETEIVELINEELGSKKVAYFLWRIER